MSGSAFGACNTPGSTFGAWATKERVAELREAFGAARPFEHVVIPGFFREDVAEALSAEFPGDWSEGGRWIHYDNPLEQKYALNRFEGLDVVRGVFDALQDDATVGLMRAVTGIADLEADPLLHGAGLHVYPRGGKLDVHLDYSIHPVTGRERRVNLIVYLNKGWRAEEYGGALELWDERMEGCTRVIAPEFNTAVLFRTSDISYHGLPRPITCPEGEARRSLAVYYVSPARSSARAEAVARPKAEFFPLPGQPVDERLARLYEIRKRRVIGAEDLWEGWRGDGGGYW